MRRVVACSLVVALLCLGVGVAAASVDLAVEGSFETPAETLTVEGEEFTVTEVARVQPGEEIEVDVTTTRFGNFQVNLYTIDEEVQDFQTVGGDETVTFGTDGLDPGSYLVAAVEDREFLAVQPVTVAGYAVAVDAPSTADTGSAFDATVTLEAIDETKAIGRVELVVWNDETRERIEMTPTGDSTYETTVDGVPAGTYDVYAVVVAEQQVDGEDDVIGYSDPQTLTVRDAPETPTPTPTETPTVTPTDTSPTPTRTATPRDGPTTATPTDASTGATPTETPTDSSTTTPTETPTDGSGGVLTPAGPDEATPADDDGAGFGVLAALGALVVILGVVLSRLG